MRVTLDEDEVKVEDTGDGGSEGWDQDDGKELKLLRLTALRLTWFCLDRRPRGLYLHSVTHHRGP